MDLAATPRGFAPAHLPPALEAPARLLQGIQKNIIFRSKTKLSHTDLRLVGLIASNGYNATHNNQGSQDVAHCDGLSEDDCPAEQHSDNRKACEWIGPGQGHAAQDRQPSCGLGHEKR